MTHGNRQDHLDDALAMVTSNRLQTLPKYMLTRLKDVISASGMAATPNHGAARFLYRFLQDTFIFTNLGSHHLKCPQEHAPPSLLS